MSSVSTDTAHNPFAPESEVTARPRTRKVKDDTSAIPVGVSPLDNGTKFRVVEFPPLDAATEAKMDPNYLMKAVGDRAPARGVAVTLRRCSIKARF